MVTKHPAKKLKPIVPGEIIALCSKHHKAKLIAPVLATLGVEVIEDPTFDTDTLGTFSGETPRELSPEQAALFKAKKACELTQQRWGLGSEGSFGGGPMPGLVNWNEEVLCLYDNVSSAHIFARAAGPTDVEPVELSGLSDIAKVIQQWPGQAWILRAADQLFKGIAGDNLEQVIRDTKMNFPLQITPDLRAMHCPPRQQMIIAAAEDLVRRMQSLCPQCGVCNFVICEAERGLPCAQCGLPTQQIKINITICNVCGHNEQSPVAATSADPAHCSLCNP